MSTTKLTKTKAATLALLQALIAGTQKHFPSESFTLGSTSYTAASLIPILQGFANAITAVNTVQANAKDTVATMHGVEATVGPIIQAYKRFVQVSFSNATQTLTDFGLTPPKVRAPLTVEQKAASAAKAKATRQARGTTSKKQKLTVKGNVTGIIVTPVIAPTAAPAGSPETPVTPSAQTVSTAPSVPLPGTATK